MPSGSNPFEYRSNVGYTPQGLASKVCSLMGRFLEEKIPPGILDRHDIAVLAFELTVAIETYLEDNEERNVT